MTLLQSLNYNWKLHRGGRITASNFHEVCHEKVDDEPNENTSSLLNKVMLYTTTPNVPVITYGQENKKRAWTQHKTLSLQEHQKFRFIYKRRIYISWSITKWFNLM